MIDWLIDQLIEWLIDFDKDWRTKNQVDVVSIR